MVKPRAARLGTVDVTVLFNGGQVASAGTFTYPPPLPTFPLIRRRLPLAWSASQAMPRLRSLGQHRPLLAASPSPPTRSPRVREGSRA